ncbi:MAG: Glycerophosphoryl diester phosphodiesterase [Verrucomicrobiota bacterium]|jgi:glycerophosphoryl diester phosphodiesterase
MTSPGRLPAPAWWPGWILITLLALLMPPGSLRSAADPAREKAASLVATNRPLIIAHRGYSGLAPENTREAFRLAMAAGSDLVELDYYHSQDGVPMVFHDTTLDRTSDAVRRWQEKKLRVSSRPAEALATLDVGSWFHPRFADQRMPRLAEALDLIQSNGVTLIERKEGDAATCVRLLRERGLINEVIVQAFDWAYLRDFHQLEPRQVLGALGPPGSRAGRRLAEDEKTLSAAWVEEARQTGARIVVWNRQIDAAGVAAARRHGLKVWAYTINDAATANALLDLGIDGIITDHPAILWRTLARRPARPPGQP